MIRYGVTQQDLRLAEITGRNPAFYPAERKYLAVHTKCCVCGQKSATAHHVIPFHVDRSKEMDETNWAPVCVYCHFVVGHLRNWRKWNAKFWLSVHAITSGSMGPIDNAG